MKKNSLRFNLWLYFAFFSLLILFFLWLIQVIFLDTYYEWTKNNELKKVVNKLESIYNKDKFEDEFDMLSFKNDLCIEIFSDDEIIYSTGNKGCLLDNHNLEEKQNRLIFINSDIEQIEYELTNQFYNNKILVHGIKLNDGNYAFVTTSLEPINSTINVLAKQYKYVTLGVLLFSFVIAYFVSRRISKPILKISEKSMLLSKGDYSVTFDENDFYELNELSNILNKATKELAQTEELRRDLMANVSHDLKTPLTIIKANAEMVKDITYKNDEKRNANLTSIIEEVDRLNLLVEDILDVSKAQSSTLELNIEKINLNSLIQDIMSRFKVLCERDGYIIDFNYDNEYFVLADKKRLDQVIYNLINNAVNYTGDDKKIIVNLKRNNDRVLVEVKDTGKGIDKKDLKHIWDKYYKVDKKYKRVTHGTGLGLSIVRSFLELHKFEYGVKTKKNNGTTFYFYIKIEE